jgi:hypothetical protein
LRNPGDLPSGWSAGVSLAFDPLAVDLLTHAEPQLGVDARRTVAAAGQVKDQAETANTGLVLTGGVIFTLGIGTVGGVAANASKKYLST